VITAPPTTAGTPSTTVDPAVNVLADPLPSGVASAELASSRRAAQQFTDALAAGDWSSARRLSSNVRSASDGQLETGYGGLDRATLLLVDGRPEDGGDRLLFVSIANEHSGAQTTLYCVEAQVQGGDVRQVAAEVLDRSPGTLGVDDVKGDPGRTDLIRQRCLLR